MKLWTGQTVSELGSRITRDGLPLAAVMLLGAGPVEMSILRAISGVAVLLLGLYAGLWVDRLRRRPILIVADLARAVCLAVIPLAALTHRLNMPLLYVVGAVTGILTVFFDVAYQTYLPTLVERENVLEGNSKLAMSSSIAEVVGPGLTGVLVQVLTAPIAILFDAISFLASAFSVAIIRKPEPRPEVVSSERPLHEAVAGLRFIRSHAVLRALAGYSATAFFFFGIFGSLYVLYAIRDLGMSAVWLQLAITAGGISNLVASATARRVSARFGVGPTFIAAAVVLGLGCFLIPMAHRPAAIGSAFFIASQLVCDYCFVTFNIHEVSVRQLVAPENVLGRVNASMRLLTFGVLPLGNVVGGAMAAVWGVRPTMYAAAAGCLAATAWLLWSPLRSLHAIDQ